MIKGCSGYLRIVPSVKPDWPNQVCISYSTKGCHYHTYKKYENNNIIWQDSDKYLPEGLMEHCNKLFRNKAFW